MQTTEGNTSNTDGYTYPNLDTTNTVTNYLLNLKVHKPSQ